MKSVTGKPSKFDAFVDKLKKESPIHIAKRMDAPKWLPWVVRVSAVIVAIFVCAIVCVGEGGSFGGFFTELFRASFSTGRRVVNLLQEIAILLLIALAVTPAFKMKFWNIGAEGQVLMGALMSVVCIKYLGTYVTNGSMSDGGLIFICLIAAIVGGAGWAVIPAIFKAKWNTNETLFTLMMNYIATGIVAFSIVAWVPAGSFTLGILPQGHLPNVGGYPYIINIIVVAILVVLVWVYLRFSKHGYEISVVGESVNTARYIGVSVPKVIIRTMLLSGMLCGVAGWLLVNGASFSITTETVGGRGFTAILVSWLGQFNPFAMVVVAFLVAFLTKGGSQLASTYNFGGSFPKIMTGIFFFIFIACEFFVNYKLKFNFEHLRKEKNQNECVADDVIDVQAEDDNKNNDATESNMDEEVTD